MHARAQAHSNDVNQRCNTAKNIAVVACEVPAHDGSQQMGRNNFCEQILIHSHGAAYVLLETPKERQPPMI